ncbi:MAG: energy-coupling factor transporter ATPase [Limnochordia bacterium]|jgi:energy-coupling factor transport system ATP-binding protein
MSIRLENVSYTYQQGTPLAVPALRNISLEINQGEFFGIIGQTGSGKSTLIQTLNGLIKPTTGRIWIDDVDITAPKVSLKDIRRQVGLVFQYPEYQLFEETVYDDVAFGPRNVGLAESEVEQRVREALRLVGIADPAILERSPFELSGGQKRRVAIAGVLAMEPKYLILDEPTAGLDPRGRDEILGRIAAMQQQGLTVILVSHNMEEVAKLVTSLAVLHQGELVAQGKPAEIFSQARLLEDVGLSIPQIAQLMHKLKGRGKDVPTDVYTVCQARDVLLQLMGKA